MIERVTLFLVISGIIMLFFAFACWVEDRIARTREQSEERRKILQRNLNELVVAMVDDEHVSLRVAFKLTLDEYRGRA